MTTTTALMLRFTGSLADLSAADRAELLDRGTSSDASVVERTKEILASVRMRGDAALRELALRYDGVAIDAIEVPRTSLARALDAIDVTVRSAMERSVRNIVRAHEALLPTASECETEPGIVVGRRPDPLGRVGVYAPGGRAVYPSSVLMGALPARVAGVRQVVVCSPPGPDGLPSPLVLAAAAIAGVDRVFAIGGAGAIAAMAYGTETVPRVDRIVGPGNAFVAEAKLQVAGTVSIDSPAGPSELLVLADASSDPRAVALEMLAQAEHDPRARAVAVVVGDEPARAIAEALALLVGDQPRRETIEEALAGGGGVLIAATLDDAIAFASDYAPEHLLIAFDGPDAGATLSRLRNAGAIFIGARSSVAFGDYMTGANHVLPTGGLARSYSGLSVLDFIRWTTYQRVSPAAARSLSSAVGVFAEAEGLPGHARAARYAGENR